MSVRVAISGAGGRMGRALLEAVAGASDLELAGSFDIGGDIRAAVSAADVLIDFTRPEGTLEHLRACVDAKRAIVIGTTGFDAAQLARIREASGEIPIVMAPNMSIGVNVMAKLVELASRALGPDYDAEVFEIHHNKKVDAPSGTALMLGAVASKARGGAIDKDAVHARHGQTGERRVGSVGFSVARGGDIVGDHTVYFAGTGERIEITHRANSRATYAQGAMRAAKFAAGRAPGLYGMNEVLGL